MKQFTIYIGLDGANENQVRARSIAINLAAEWLNGTTIQDGIGLWQGELESSVVVTVLAGEGNRVWEFARAVRSALDQDCVLVTEQEVAATFVKSHGTT